MSRWCSACNCSQAALRLRCRRAPWESVSKVLHTQVSSTIGKPKVSACIAAQVKTWKFPARPGEGNASASYSVVFQ